MARSSASCAPLHSVPERAKKTKRGGRWPQMRQLCDSGSSKDGMHLELAGAMNEAIVGAAGAAAAAASGEDGRSWLRGAPSSGCSSSHIFAGRQVDAPAGAPPLDAPAHGPLPREQLVPLTCATRRVLH
eukprot:2009513-Prymnesium_polylepis.1